MLSDFRLCFYLFMFTPVWKEQEEENFRRCFITTCEDRKIYIFVFHAFNKKALNARYVGDNREQKATEECAENICIP